MATHDADAGADHAHTEQEHEDTGGAAIQCVGAQDEQDWTMKNYDRRQRRGEWEGVLETRICEMTT